MGRVNLSDEWVGGGWVFRKCSIGGEGVKFASGVCVWALASSV